MRTVLVRMSIGKQNGFSKAILHPFEKSKAAGTAASFYPLVDFAASISYGRTVQRFTGRRATMTDQFTPTREATLVGGFLRH